MLYTVEGDIPAMFANSLIAIFRSLHNWTIRLAIASLVRKIYSSFTIGRKNILTKITINRVGYIAFFQILCYNCDIS